MKDKYNPKLNSSHVEAFLEFIHTAQKVQSENTIVLKELNSKQQDLLHDIEIPDKLMKKDIAKIGEDLRNLRRERRRIKDDLVIAEIIMAMVKKNSSMVDDLETLVSKLKSEERYLDERTYTIKSTLVKETENLDADKLKTTVNKMNIVISKLIKNWGTVEVVNVGKSDVSFTLFNNVYDRPSAISAFKNIKYLLSKEIEGIFVEVEVADFPVNTMESSTMKGVLRCKLPDGTKCTVTGSISYPYKTQKPFTSNKRKGGKKR